MEIRYRLEFNELIKFLINNFKKTNNYFNYAVKNAIITTVIMLLIMCYGGIIANGKLPFTIVQLIIIVIILIPVLSLVLIKKYEAKFKKIYSLKRFRYLFMDTTIKIEETYLKYFTQLGAMEFSISSIEGIYDLNDYIFIVTSYNKNIIIPTKAFKNSDLKIEFLMNISDNGRVKVKNTFPKEYIFFR